MPTVTLRFRILISTALCCAALSTTSARAQAFAHPGILSSGKELEFIKAKIQARQNPWYQAFEALAASPYSSLDYKAHPFRTVACGSYNNPNIGCDEMVDDGMAAYSLSLMGYFTGDPLYQKNAVGILNAWTGIYRSNTDSNARLVVSWAVPWYVNAAEILRHTGADWRTEEIQVFTAMLTERMLPYTLDESMPGNNWIQSAIEAHMAIAIFTDDRALFEKAVSRWRFRVKTYIYQASDGPAPIGPPGKTPDQVARIWRQTSAGTDYVDGLAMETCRDLGHLFLGFKSMMYAAKYAWQQGEDLFAPEQKRIADFLELHGRWMTGASEVPAGICGGKLWLSPDRALGRNGGGGQALEIAYNHIGIRLGNAVPATASMLDRYRPAKAAHWVSKWETLTEADVPVFHTGLRIPLRPSAVNPARLHPRHQPGILFPYAGWAHRADGARGRN